MKMSVLTRVTVLVAVVVSVTAEPVIVFSESTVNTVMPGFKSWNIDLSADRGFFQRNLTDPKVLYMAAHDSPGVVRVGGTGNDEVWYGVVDDCAGQAAAKMPQCLNATMFDNLMAFAAAAKTKVVFGLNIMVRTAASSSHLKGQWDSTNAEQLIRYAIGKGHNFYGFELGNEKNEVFTPQETAADFQILFDLLKTLYPDASTRPGLFGPDPHSFKGVPPSSSLLDFLKGFAEAIKSQGTPLVAVTHHEYVESTVSTATSHSLLDETETIAKAVNATVRDVLGTDVALFAGEIGPHNGGSPGCGTEYQWANFADSFWYIDAMGAKARNGYQAFCRQDFVGISYGLIDCAKYTPFPDYYTGIVWSATMGTGVLATKRAGDAFRMYAHCAAGDDLPAGAVTVLLLNLVTSSTDVEVQFSASDQVTLGDDTVSMFQFTAGALDSQTVELNGKPLTFDETHWLLPDLLPTTVSVKDGALTLPPQSISFVVFPNAGAPACK